jgi:hypothetical protein
LIWFRGEYLVLASSWPYIGQSDWLRADGANKVSKQRTAADIPNLTFEDPLVIPNFDVSYYDLKRDGKKVVETQPGYVLRLRQENEMQPGYVSTKPVGRS